eukprot:s6023_g2.t1
MGCADALGREGQKARPSTTVYSGRFQYARQAKLHNPDKSGVHSFLGLTMSPKSPDHSRKQEEMQMHRQEVALPTRAFPALLWLVQTRWCEKLLLRSSDSLRPQKGEAPAMKVPGPALSSAPAPKGIDVEAAMPRQTVQAAQRAPTPALASKKEVQEEPRNVILNAEDLHVGKVLGSGGFGAVYRGTYRGEEVAIKKLHLIDGQVTPEQKNEFQKEVMNLARLRHPRLVSFIGAALVAPSLMIVTEFMPNGSLYEALHQRKLALELVKRFKIATQASFPESLVVMDFELNAKLCDFGLTQSMEKTHISCGLRIALLFALWPMASHARLRLRAAD